MALVPAASGAADLDEFSVKIEPAQRRLANIQTAKVESGAGGSHAANGRRYRH